MATSLRKLADNLGELTTVPSRVAKAFAGDVNKFLQEEFTDGVDPYGESFEGNAESTIRRKGFDQPMVETGETQRETVARPLAGAGIEIRSTEKAGYNMFARGDVPARPVLPADDELPDRWQDALEKRIDAAMRSKK